MKIFLTGASGFVGGATAVNLKNDHEIFAMARSENSAKKVKAVGCTPVICDLQSVTPDNLSSCEIVIHCAAYAEEWGMEEDFFSANVLGTRQLLKSSKSAGIKKFIFIGTEAGLFHGQDMIDIDESYPYSKKSPYPYSRTKAQAEQEVLSANSPSFQTISLRPRMIWGPNDQSILPTLLEMIRLKKFAWIGKGNYRTSTTHITNLIHAIELSLKRGNGGNAYFISDEGDTIMKDFLSSYVATQGVSIPNRSLPKSVARLIGIVCEWIWKTFGLKNKPPLVRFTADIMSAHCTVRTDKAKRELNYHPLISTKDGLREMPRLNH